MRKLLFCNGLQGYFPAETPAPIMRPAAQKPRREASFRPAHGRNPLSEMELKADVAETQRLLP